MLTRIILSTLTVALAAGAALGFSNARMMPLHATNKPTLSDDIRTVLFCELVRHPELYADKLIRVSATYVSTFELRLLYDPKCEDKENNVWPFFACESEQACKTMRETLDKNVSGDPFSGNRAQLIIIGRLRGPKAKHRYGVQDGCRLAFSIERIERANPLHSVAR